MKKILIAAALVITSAGILQSSTKQSAPKPAAATIEQNQPSFRKDIGTAD
jgi:hypothetical protein